MIRINDTNFLVIRIILRLGIGFGIGACFQKRLKCLSLLVCRVFLPFHLLMIYYYAINHTLKHDSEYHFNLSNSSVSQSIASFIPVPTVAEHNSSLQEWSLISCRLYSLVICYSPSAPFKSCLFARISIGAFFKFYIDAMLLR